MKNIYIIFCLFIFLQNQLFAHSGKPKYHIIIDTDGAIDDLRAISMLLAGNDIRVLAITCSQGTLKPNSCYEKVNSLLATYYHNGIPVGKSESINYPLPVWNNFAEQIKWGTIENLPKSENSIDLLNSTVKDYPFKITLIALGSMKTYADWLKLAPENTQKIERIIWYNDVHVEQGFNYLIDTASYNFILKSNIPIEIVSDNRNDLICNDEYLSYLKNNNSIYAQQIFNVHQQPSVLEKVVQNHLQLWDDLLPLYLTLPMLFNANKVNNITSVSIIKSIPTGTVYDCISKLLKSGTSVNNRVFVTFPTDTALYKQEYAKILKSTIEKYGEIEWKAITMTNEIHGHTGIYSIIGAKMGVRACEYFNVGVNNLKVTTFVGSTPPYSCLNDGIQISTGATIGQGLITVSDSTLPIPTVIFEFNNQKIKVSLSPKISEQMQNDIEIGIKNFGMTNEYWNYIERLSIKYWTDFDRHNLFLIERI
jgi:pyrimidine-specific ribonucleoside hydrolase